MSVADAERLAGDLIHDRVISSQTARRLYSVTLGQARAVGLYVTLPLHVPRWAGSQRLVRTRFYVDDSSALSLSPSQLRHLAAATALRHCIGASARDWSNDADRPRALHVPDALWHQPDGRTDNVAVEIDTGGYSSRQIAAKTRTFACAYGRQLWGVPTPHRGQKVRQEIVRAESPWHAVRVAAWWC